MGILSSGGTCCSAPRRVTRWLSEETRDATRRRARALTSDAATTTEHDTVAPTPVRLTILQQCSHLSSRRRRTSREPPRNTDLKNATESGLRVLKLTRAQVSRALILSGSSSRRRAREIYVPSRRDCPGHYSHQDPVKL